MRKSRHEELTKVAVGSLALKGGRGWSKDIFSSFFLFFSLLLLSSRFFFFLRLMLFCMYVLFYSHEGVGAWVDR